jgi:hypothetical protein
MYNFVFWFFYKYFSWKDKLESISLAAATVMLTMVIHANFVYMVFCYFSGFRSQPSEMTYGQRKYALLPIALLLNYLIYRLYYKAHGKAILNKYADVKPFTTRNIIRVLAIMLLPLLAAIAINKQVFK